MLCQPPNIAFDLRRQLRFFAIRRMGLQLRTRGERQHAQVSFASASQLRWEVRWRRTRANLSEGSIPRQLFGEVVGLPHICYPRRPAFSVACAVGNSIRAFFTPPDSCVTGAVGALHRSQIWETLGPWTNNTKGEPAYNIRINVRDVGIRAVSGEQVMLHTQGGYS